MRKMHLKKSFEKIIIMGDAGRGKSTLASRLSKKLGVPHYSTDDYYYEVKFSNPKEKQQSIDEISKLYHNQKWIVEGTTHHLLEPGLLFADTIIHLSHKNIANQWACIIRRYFQRDNEKLIDLLKLMRHVLYKKYGWGHRKGKPTNAELIAPHQEKVITLSSFKEINAFPDTF